MEHYTNINAMVQAADLTLPPPEKRTGQTVLFYKKTAAAYCAERAGKRAKAHMQY